MNRTAPRLGLEPLEARDCPAVTANLFNGVLTVTGDEAANTITISRSGANFVAAGQGGHTFAMTLTEHNRNVERWRQIQRERAEQQSQTPPGTPAAPVQPSPGQQRPAPRP